MLDAIVEGRRILKPVACTNYRAFVDMSGGSSDDATLAIAHRDVASGQIVVDLVDKQSGKAPFNPRTAVAKFAQRCKKYQVASVTGDRYAGETFRRDFTDHSVGYTVSPLTKSQLYEALEPRINAGEVELLDEPRLREQLLGLVTRGTKVDHLPGDHDDYANAVAGAVHLCAAPPIDWEAFVALNAELQSSGPSTVHNEGALTTGEEVLLDRLAWLNRRNEY